MCPHRQAESKNMTLEIKRKHKNVIAAEREHFDEKSKIYGHSWWGQATFAGRHRLKRKQDILNNFLERHNSRLLLEIGCGAGELTSRLQKGIEAVAMDISFDLVKIGKNNNPSVEYLLADAMKMPFKDETFDAVVGDGILHHLNLQMALNEINRVLKRSGGILFFEPNMLNPQIFLERNVPLVRMFHQTPGETAFTRRQMKTALEKTNWKNIHIRPFDFLHPATPEFLIAPVKNAGYFFEKMPLLKEIAGSLWIEAVK